MPIRLPFSMMIFIGSYLPLSLILLVQDYQFGNTTSQFCWSFLAKGSPCSLPFDNPGYSIGGFVVCVSCLLFTFFAIRVRGEGVPVTVKTANHKSTELMNYTLPYVVSFMGINFQNTDQFIGFIIFFVWMFMISFKSGQVIFNPVLIIFGWKLYEVTFRYSTGQVDHTGLALSRDEVISGADCTKTDLQKVMILTVTQPSEDFDA